MPRSEMSQNEKTNPFYAGLSVLPFGVNIAALIQLVQTAPTAEITVGRWTLTVIIMTLLIVGSLGLAGLSGLKTWRTIVYWIHAEALLLLSFAMITFLGAAYIANQTVVSAFIIILASLVFHLAGIICFNSAGNKKRRKVMATFHVVGAIAQVGFIVYKYIFQLAEIEWSRLPGEFAIVAVNAALFLALHKRHPIELSLEQNLKRLPPPSDEYY